MKQHNYFENINITVNGDEITPPVSFVPDLFTERSLAIVDQEFLLELASQMAVSHFNIIRDTIAERIHHTQSMPELISQLDKEITFLRSIQLVTQYKETTEALAPACGVEEPSNMAY